MTEKIDPPEKARPGDNTQGQREKDARAARLAAALRANLGKRKAAARAATAAAPAKIEPDADAS
ncbi:hypothetical protein LB518_06960 [Mesorhizobium sp. BR1-1-16]|uniref:hypothetical protein n=1 Tax=Mesorhizobium sp. BR1-1-16 TaxID=2876653 RepID=UPI001CCED08C|nr:hypothetical protein [Mesorhizobium sp. BR1-1-16]MBZ9936025.1 hypothetical protein [Mesorhizobium sp. BR1-1-16]